MAQHHDIEPPQEQFGPQLNQEQWAQENYDNSPHLVYKTGTFQSPNYFIIRCVLRLFSLNEKHNSQGLHKGLPHFLLGGQKIVFLKAWRAKFNLIETHNRASLPMDIFLSTIIEKLPGFLFSYYLF